MVPRQSSLNMKFVAFLGNRFGRFLEQWWSSYFWQVILFWQFAYGAKNAKCPLCIMKLLLLEQDIYCLWYCTNLNSTAILGIIQRIFQVALEC